MLLKVLGLGQPLMDMEFNLELLPAQMLMLVRVNLPP